MTLEFDTSELYDSNQSLSPENSRNSSTRQKEVPNESINKNFDVDLSDESNMDISISPSKSHLNEFKIFENGSKRGKDILIHNNYTFLVKCKTKLKIIWRCGKKSKKLNCPAIVFQYGEQEFSLEKPHIHEPDKIDNYYNIQVRLNMKEDARNNPSSSGLRIAENALLNIPEHSGKVVKLQALQRYANRYKGDYFGKNPTSKEFDLSAYDIPKSFKCKDFSSENNRTIIFYTKRQKQYIEKCKLLFLDGTFKIIAPPFKQLYSIHGFIKTANSYKNIPLMFVFMTNKDNISYKNVLKVC